MGSVFLDETSILRLKSQEKIEDDFRADFLGQNMSIEFQLHLDFLRS